MRQLTIHIVASKEKNVVVRSPCGGEVALWSRRALAPLLICVTYMLTEVLDSPGGLAASITARVRSRTRSETTNSVVGSRFL
jgi:hypothetical protein